MTGVSPAEVAAFEVRVKRATTGPRYRLLLDELRADPGRSKVLLQALVRSRSRDTRSWAMNAARKLLGHDAVPILMSVTGSRSPEVLAEAIQELEAIDPDLLRDVIPQLRRIFTSGASVLYGPAKFAMFGLARVRDPEAATLFRAFAESQDPRHYVYRMPLVLANYIDDPSSVPARIDRHDHDWMFWLTDAAAALRLQEAMEPLAHMADAAPDEECKQFCREAYDVLQRPEPPWEIEIE